MTLHVFVGSLTRYYAGDWEGSAPEDRPDPAALHRAVLAWRDGLSEALAKTLPSALDWDERADAPFRSERPGWAGYHGLVLWAAHDDYPKPMKPERPLEDLTADKAFLACQKPGVTTRYPHLVRKTALFLPCDFPFTFKAPDVAGDDVAIGSSVALLRELETLNQRTFRADDTAMTGWLAAGATPESHLKDAARFGLAFFLKLARLSVSQRLPVKVDADPEPLRAKTVHQRF